MTVKSRQWVNFAIFLPVTAARSGSRLKSRTLRLTRITIIMYPPIRKLVMQRADRNEVSKENPSFSSTFFSKTVFSAANSAASDALILRVVSHNKTYLKLYNRPKSRKKPTTDGKNFLENFETLPQISTGKIGSIDIHKKPRCPTSYTTHVKIRSGS